METPWTFMNIFGGGNSFEYLGVGNNLDLYGNIPLRETKVYFITFWWGETNT